MGTDHRINMAAVQKLEYADIAANFGKLPPLIGRPNVHSIHALKNQCISTAMAIANPAAPDMGSAGIFMNRGEYAMSDPTLMWIHPTQALSWKCWRHVSTCRRDADIVG